jgi:hypothetical protein
MTRQKHEDAMELMRQLSKLLHGRDTDLQAVVLADLVALWLVGHHPSLRDESKGLWLDLLDDLVPIVEEAVLAQAGVTSWDDLPDGPSRH